MNSVLSIVPAVAATVFLFLSSVGVLSPKSDHPTLRASRTVDTQAAPNEQPLQTTIAHQGQLVFSAVPAARNYSLLIRPQFATGDSPKRDSAAAAEGTPFTVREHRPDLLQVAQANPEGMRPTLTTDTTKGDMVPAPTEKAASQWAVPESKQTAVESKRRVCLDAGLTVSGWQNAIRKTNGKSPTVPVRAIPPAVPVSEP